MDYRDLTTRLVELRTGRPKPLGRSGVTSAIDKQRRSGPVWVGKLGVEGDEQAEAVIHGGPYKALLQYALHHYEAWRAEVPDIAHLFGPGGFGENLVADGLDESNVCIGDRVRVGGALLQVVQSRQPCYKLNHRFGRDFISRRTQETFRTGWYYSVIEPGFVAPGDTIAIVEREADAWPVARIQHYLYREPKNMEAARALANLNAMAPSLRGVFAKRVEAARVEDWEDRLWNRPPVADDEPDWFEVTVDAVHDETASVKGFRLSPVAGRELPAFDPGAHIDVRLADGTSRHYSICNLVSDGYYEIGVGLTANGRGGAKFLHEQVAAGTRLTVSRPRNSFPAILGAETHLLIAGGIGITPFLSMIRGFELTGDRYVLHYCARDAAAAPFLDRLAAMVGKNGTLHRHFTGGDPRARLPVAELLAPVDDGTHVYCCGPAGLMDAVHRATRHWPARRVHFESFVPLAVKDIADCRAFQIRIASSGRVLDVPADRSILDVLRQAGLTIPSSCESGTCGTCKVRYRDGIVDHRDYVLSPSEQREFLTACVSRASSEIVTLDL